jgi:hypothetical protein
LPGENSIWKDVPDVTARQGNRMNPPIRCIREFRNYHRGNEYSEAQIFWIVKHGIRYSGMFANGKFNSDEKMWTMAAYIKRIKELPPHVREELSKPAAK